MKPKRIKKDEINISKLIADSIELYISNHSEEIPSEKYSEIAEYGKDKIIILRDSGKNILAHFQLLKDGSLLEINN